MARTTVVRIKAFLALVAAVAAVWGLALLPGVLDDMELFRVADVRLEGASFLTLAQAVESLDLAPDASIWDDTEPLEAALEAHPLVRDARIGRRPPGTLVLTVAERVPVALVPSPTLEPVDVTGSRLPIDPALHRLDLPVIRPWAPGASELTPEQLRGLALEVVRLADADPEFFGVLSDLSRDERGGVVVRAGDPEVTIRYEAPLPAQRLKEGLLVLEDASRRPGSAPSVIDLRYIDQVVVRYDP